MKKYLVWLFIVFCSFGAVPNWSYASAVPVSEQIEAKRVPKKKIKKIKKTQSVFGLGILAASMAGLFVIAALVFFIWGLIQKIVFAKMLGIILAIVLAAAIFLAALVFFILLLADGFFVPLHLPALLLLILAVLGFIFLFFPALQLVGWIMGGIALFLLLVALIVLLIFYG